MHSPDVDKQGKEPIEPRGQQLVATVSLVKLLGGGWQDGIAYHFRSNSPPESLSLAGAIPR
jgi:hypothetical protein